MKLIYLIMLFSILTINAFSQVILTELMINPQTVSDTDGEWFELYNDADTIVDLYSCYLSDGGSGRFAFPRILIQPGQHLVFARQLDPELNGGVPANYRFSGIRFTNESGEISLWKDSALIDKITYNSKNYSSFNGRSLSLSPEHYDPEQNDHPENWCLGQQYITKMDQGSPGDQNTLCSLLNSGLVITELMIDPSAVPDSRGEWIEFFNPGPYRLSIEGMQVSDLSGGPVQIDSAIILHPNSFFIMGKEYDPLLNGGIEIDLAMNGITLFNSVGTLELLENDSLIDAVSYDSDWPLAEGRSMTLSGSFFNQSDNDLSENWCLGVTPINQADYGSPGSENISCEPGPGEIVISEIMMNPEQVSDASGEWIELYNRTSLAIDLSSWTISNSRGFELRIRDSQHPIIGPGSYFLLGKSQDSLLNGGIQPDYTYSGFTLPNDSATLYLFREGHLIDSLRYSALSGTTVCLGSRYLQNDADAKTICSGMTSYGMGDLGSPGAVNRACEILPGEIIITELMPDPINLSDSDGEWFELYNTSKYILPIESITLSDSVSDFHAITSTPPLVCRPRQTLLFTRNTIPGVDSDYIYSGIQFNNSSDQLILHFDGVLIDQISYSDKESNLQAGRSLSLSAGFYDHVENDQTSYWCNGFLSFPSGDLGTPGQVNPKCFPERGDLVITEIMKDPAAVPDSRGEWIEVLNPGTSVINLKQLVIRDSASDWHRITEDLPIDPGEFLVLGRNGDPSMNGGLLTDYIYSGFSLGNESDQVILESGSMIIDQVYYDGGREFPDPAGSSISLSYATTGAFENDLGIHWCVSEQTYGDGDFGTPGETNPICGILPVELIAFDLYLEDSGIKISWATAWEEENDYFMLRKGRKFGELTLLDTVYADRTSVTGKYYEVFDPNPYHGNSYYELSQTDVDGTTTVLGLEQITFAVNEWSLYPNPSDKQMQIQGPEPIHEVKIYSSRGDLMMPPTTKHTLDISCLKPGIYLVSIQHRRGVESLRLIRK